MVRKAIYVSGIVAVLVLAGLWVTGLGANLLLPLFQNAGTSDQCTVIHPGCHDRRFAVNQQYEDLYESLRLSPQICTAVLKPIDALQYSTTLENGRCTLEVQLSETCQAGELPEGSAERCEEHRNIIENVYGGS